MDQKHEKAALDLIQRMMAIEIPQEVPPPMGKRPRAWIEGRDGQVYVCFWPGGDPLQLRVIDMVYPLAGTIPEEMAVIWRLQQPHLSAGYPAVNEPAAYVYAAALAVSSKVRETTFLAPLAPHIQGDGDIVRSEEELPPIPTVPNWVYRAQFVERIGRKERYPVVVVDPETLAILPDDPLEPK
jgi:hypothetical protein